MADPFTAAVKDWAQKSEVQQTAILHQSLRLLDHATEEATPRKSGNLSNSRTLQSGARVTIDWRTKKFRDPSDAINNAIAGVEVGQTVFLGFRAPYAFKVEKARGFFRLVAQRWAEIVDAAAKSLTRN